MNPRNRENPNRFLRILGKLHWHLSTFGLKHVFYYAYRYVLWWAYTFLVRQRYFSDRRRRSSRPRVRQDEAAMVHDIVAEGRRIIADVLEKNRNVHSSRTDLHFLFHRPPGGAALIYFNNLVQCLQHVGIGSRIYDPSSEKLEEVLSEYQPTVYIAIDAPHFMKLSDLDVLVHYKSDHQLARLFIPYLISPLRIRQKPSSIDIWRQTVCKEGRLADAFMSFFEDIYWDTFCNHFWEIGLKYIAVPFAVNPMVHVPTDGNHDLDWGMASSNGDMGVRASITYRYMRRIIRRYQGEIVGNHWGAPIGPIPYSQIPSFHARIRISPNLAAESNIRYPIDCGSKVHELASLGSFQIASENSALRKYYAPDEVVACRNPHEFNDLFDYYIDRPDDRSACVVKAMRRSITENTYFNRINALIGVLDARPEFFLY